MEGFWKIEDTHECVSIINSVWSINGIKNTVLASEAEILLNLVETVVCNMRGCDEGKIKAHKDCYKVWTLLKADKLKESQFSGDRGSIMSKVIALESKTKIEVEYVHVKTKTGDEDAITTKGLTMVLECD